jgi:hypothetical protein
MTAAEAIRLLETLNRPAQVTALTDPQLWGREIDDERYIIVSPAV